MRRDRIVHTIEERLAFGREPHEAVGEYLWLLRLSSEQLGLSPQTVEESEQIAAEWLGERSSDEDHLRARLLLARAYADLLAREMKVGFEENPAGITTHPQLNALLARWRRGDQ